MGAVVTKQQAYHAFYASFGLKAYDETSVPDSAILPYITYEMQDDFFGSDLASTASLWYRSSSWAEITAKANEISSTIGLGGKIINYDGGAFWIRRGTPWAQRMSDASDDSVRRIVLNVVIEFIE